MFTFEEEIIQNGNSPVMLFLETGGVIAGLGAGHIIFERPMSLNGTISTVESE